MRQKTNCRERARLISFLIVILVSSLNTVNALSEELDTRMRYRAAPESGSSWLPATIALWFSVFPTGSQQGVPVMLVPNKRVGRAIKGGETHSYATKVKIDQFLRVVVRQRGIDVVVRVYAPDGSLLEERDRPNGRYGEESLSVEVSVEGIYRVEVKPLEDKAKAGQYVVKIEQLRSTTALDKRRISAEKSLREAEKLRLERKEESWKSAIPMYQEAAAAWHEIGDSYAEGLTLSTLTIIYAGLKQADKAMETETKALAIFRALKDRSAEGVSLMHMAQLFSAKGDYEEALKHYELSAEARRIVQDAEGESAALSGAAGVLSSLGDSQNSSGDKAKAAKSYRRAITLYQSAGDTRGVARLLDRLGRMSLGEQPELVMQTGHTGSVMVVVYSPTYPVVASADFNNIILWGASGHKLRSFLCDIRDGAPTALLRHNPLAVGTLRQYCHLAFSPDGKFLTSVSISNSLFQKTLDQKKWNVLTGEPAGVNRFKLNSDDKDNNPYETVAISADGTRGAAANSVSDSIVVIDFDEQRRHVIENQEGRVQYLRFSFDSRTVAALTNNQTVTMWDVSSGRKTQSFDDCKDLFAISNQGKLLACGASDNSINLWDTTTGKRLPSLTGQASRVVSLTFSPDGKKLVLGGEDKSLTVWDLTASTKIRGLSSDRITTAAVAFSPDGGLLTSGADKTVTLWNAGAAKELRRFMSSVSGVGDVTISQRKKLLAVCLGNRLNLWDLSSGRRVRTFNAGYTLSSVAFSVDGNVVAAGGRSDKVTLWDVDTGAAKTLNHFDGFAGRLLFSPEGDKIAATTMMGVRLIIVDIKSGSLVISEAPDTVTMSTEGSTMRSAKGKVPEWAEFDKFERTGAVIDNGGTLIHVSHTSEQIKFQDPTTGRELASFIEVEPNDWLVTTPEGFFDGTAGAWKKLLWRFNNNTFDYGAVELYFNEFFHPDLLQDVLAGKSPKPTAGRELEKRDRRQPTVKIASINGTLREEINVQSTYHSSTERSAVTVAVEVTDGTGEKKQASHNATSGAQDLRLFRDGSLVKVWHGDLFNLPGTSGCEQIKPATPDQPRSVRCQAVVSVTAGEHTFTTYAFNSSKVKSNDDVLSFNSPNGSKRRGTFYVLAVGVNDYLRAGKLRYAVDDATELAAVLQREQGKLGVYASTQVITLTDAEATKKNILLALTRFRSDGINELPPNVLRQLQLIKPLGPEDALVIVFSGHGVADDKSFYLLPQDINAAKFQESAVSDTELNNILEHIDAGQLLLIIDACRSGKALGEPKDGRGPMNSKGLAQLAYDKGMSILTAAQSYQAALGVSRTLTGKDIKHGLLTFALLDGLTNKKAADASGNVLERTWFDYAAGAVPRMQIEEMKRRHLQVPRVFYRREENPHPLIIAKP